MIHTTKHLEDAGPRVWRGKVKRIGVSWVGIFSMRIGHEVAGLWLKIYYDCLMSTLDASDNHEVFSFFSRDYALKVGRNVGAIVK